MNQMSKMILLCSPRKAYIDFHDIGLQLRRNEKIYTEIHHQSK
jgi:hypothetical protein